MSWYCYKLANGDIRDEQFPIGTAPVQIRFEDGQMGQRCHAAEWSPPMKELRGTTKGWPIESFAHGVHPLDRKALIEDAAAHGVPTDVNERGNPIIRNLSHQRRFNRYKRAYDRDGFVG